MINWSNDIPNDPRGHALPLLRTPTSSELHAIITSENLIGTDTHFWGGHTVPCTGHDCEPCKAGSPFRWHAYQSAYNPLDQLHFIFECTAHAAQAFKKFRQEHNTLRACDFHAYRWKRRRNGRVIIRCVPATYRLDTLPPAPDLEKIMAIIWRLPIPNVFVAGQQRGHPRVHADPNGNGDSSDPLEYASNRP